MGFLDGNVSQKDLNGLEAKDYFWKKDRHESFWILLRSFCWSISWTPQRANWNFNIVRLSNWMNLWTVGSWLRSKGPLYKCKTSFGFFVTCHCPLWKWPTREKIVLYKMTVFIETSDWPVSLTSLTLSHVTCFLLNAAVMRAFFGGLSLSQWSKRYWACSMGSVRFLKKGWNS